jgi:PAS domain S-box-containing protein
MALKMNLAHMGSIVEFSSDAIISQTLDGVIKTWNKGAEELYGYTAEEAIGKPIAIIQPPQSDNTIFSSERCLRESGFSRKLEATLRHKNGSLIDASLSISAIYNSAGHVTHIATISRDISKTRRSERERRLLLDISMALNEVEGLPAALEVTLQKVCEATGWVLGMAWIPQSDGTALERCAAWQIPSPALSIFRDETAKQVFPQGVGLPGRVWSLKKAAWIRDVTRDSNFPRAPFAQKAGLKAGMGIPVLSGEGVIAVIEFFVFDTRREDESLLEVVSAVASQLGASILRKQVEKDLRKHEQQLADANIELQREILERQRAISVLAATLESTADAILVINQNWEVVVFNQNFKQIWGISDEILSQGKGNQAREAFLGRLADPETFLEKVKAFNAEPSVISHDEIIFKDGRIIECDSRPHLIGSKVVGRVWSFRDITKKKQAEMEIHRIAWELAISNRDLEQFAYVASHDLQEPLRMVASYTELLAQRYRGKFDSEADEFIAYIIDGSARLRAMIREILDYSRISKQEVFEPTDCAVPLNQALGNLQASILESGAAITIGSMPRLSVNPELLAYLFQNLISNAIKYRGANPPLIRIEAKHAGSEHVFSIQDNGIGFDMKYAHRIFVLFQRLHSRSEYPGSGIGLASCKRIVEHHRGRIWVESEEGLGSTFYFTIPEGLESRERRGA